MVRRCSDKMAKLLLVVFNLLFLVCGIALLWVSANEFRNAESINTLSKLSNVNIGAIVLGASIVLISFLGCCGALKENSCMLTGFMLILIVVLIGEITVGYLAFDNRHKVEGAFRDNALKTLPEVQNSTLLKQAWDDIQSTWKCCGVEGYTDYTSRNLPIPSSCCKEQPHEMTCTPSSKVLQHDGCLGKIKDFFESHSLEIGVAALLIAFIEVAGIIFACCLRSAVNDRYGTV